MMWIDRSQTKLSNHPRHIPLANGEMLFSFRCKRRSFAANFELNFKLWLMSRSSLHSPHDYIKAYTPTAKSLTSINSDFKNPILSFFRTKANTFGSFPQKSRNMMRIYSIIYIDQSQIYAYNFPLQLREYVCLYHYFHSLWILDRQCG